MQFSVQMLDDRRLNAPPPVRRLQAVLDLYVKPSVPVVSYLTALTGLTEATLEMYGRPLEESLRFLREQLPRHAILVGQNIRKDVEWLGLKEGVDFESLMDLVRGPCIRTSPMLYFRPELSYLSVVWTGLHMHLHIHSDKLLSLHSLTGGHVSLLEPGLQELERLWPGPRGQGALGLGDGAWRCRPAGRRVA